MLDFEPIHSQALLRKGGEHGLESWITESLSDEKFKPTPNDRILATMTKCIFQAGFLVAENLLLSRVLKEK